MARDAIRIRDLKLDCTIGVNPDERTREQPLLAQIELELDLAAAGRSGTIADICNYDCVADEVAVLLRFCCYRLLESAAEEVSAMLLAVHPTVEAVRLRLDKPEALRGRAGAAGVEVLRRPDDFPRRFEVARFGSVEGRPEGCRLGAGPCLTPEAKATRRPALRGEGRAAAPAKGEDEGGEQGVGSHGCAPNG